MVAPMNNQLAPENIKANLEKVNPAVEELLPLITAYLTSKDMSYVDVFMVVHNVHKFIVKGIAEEWERQGIPMEKTLRMADMTFRNSMRELRRSTPLVN